MVKKNLPANLKTSKLLVDVSIRSRSKVLYEGKVSSVTSFNAVGEFDVLPQHANFISLIKDRVILNKGRSNEQVIEIKSGLMNTLQDSIDVYTGI